MNTQWKHALMGMGLLATLGLAGCTFHAHPGVEVEAYPAGYSTYPDTAYDPVYYDRGYYDGPNWVWFGPDHHRYYERREFHERRYHDRHWR